VLNHFYNEDGIPVEDYARIGQYAENHWWMKASGLMDQMACAVGGTILLDFADGVHVEKVEFTFDDVDCDLLIINTGKGHADLSAEYSSVPEEMRLAAKQLGTERLCGASEEELLSRLPQIRNALRNDRAILRAMHYYEECGRVDAALRAVREGRKQDLLPIIRESGNSSWKWLQNCYVPADPEEQSIPLTLALAERYFARAGKGVCRVHGGGFAGVIMCVVPKEMTDGFTDYMAPFAGRDNIYRMGIRRAGAVYLDRQP
jgi:galactokinase